MLAMFNDANLNPLVLGIEFFDEEEHCRLI